METIDLELMILVFNTIWTNSAGSTHLDFVILDLKVVVCITQRTPVRAMRRKYLAVAAESLSYS